MFHFVPSFRENGAYLYLVCTVDVFSKLFGKSLAEVVDVFLWQASGDV